VGVKGSRPDFESLNLDARTTTAPEEKTCNKTCVLTKRKNSEEGKRACKKIIIVLVNYLD